VKIDLFKNTMDAYNNNNFFNNLVVAYGINLIAYTIALLLIISTLTMFRRAPTTSLLAWGESSAHPQMRFSIIVALLSLSGVPPLFGFFSKFFLILAIATKGS
jgi:NADH:ubiquinone oxidoreductase subunit 2 (subunit N)